MLVAVGARVGEAMRVSVGRGVNVIVGGCAGDLVFVGTGVSMAVWVGWAAIVSCTKPIAIDIAVCIWAVEVNTASVSEIGAGKLSNRQPRINTSANRGFTRFVCAKNHAFNPPTA